MKDEIGFNITALNTPMWPKLFLGWGKSTWPQVGYFKEAIRGWLQKSLHSCQKVKDMVPKTVIPLFETQWVSHGEYRLRIICGAFSQYLFNETWCHNHCQVPSDPTSPIFRILMAFLNPNDFPVSKTSPTVIFPLSWLIPDGHPKYPTYGHLKIPHP